MGNLPKKNVTIEGKNVDFFFKEKEFHMKDNVCLSRS